MSERKIAFIGFPEYTNVMRFFGFDCFEANDIKEAEEKIKLLKEENYSLIFISQDVAPDDVGLERVVVLPGITVSSDEQYLKKEIVKAIGGEIDLSVK
jgi:vacuolar-type H+-ATPase subunit F/Vma7